MAAHKIVTAAGLVVALTIAPVAARKPGHRLLEGPTW